MINILHPALLSFLFAFAVVAAPPGPRVPPDGVRATLEPVQAECFIGMPQLVQLRITNLTKASLGCYRASCYLMGNSLRVSLDDKACTRRGWSGGMCIGGMEGQWCELPAGETLTVLVDVGEFRLLREEGTYRVHDRTYVGPFPAGPYGLPAEEDLTFVDVATTLVVRAPPPDGAKRVADELALRYKDGDTMARFGIIRILGHWDVAESTRLLGEALVPNAHYQGSAAQYLGKRGDQVSVDLLAGRIFDPANRLPLDSSLLRYLGASPLGRQQLWQRIGVASPVSRRRILEALVRTDVPADDLTRRAIVTLLGDRDPKVREAAEAAKRKRESPAPQ